MRRGFYALGLSMGGLVARGFVQMCPLGKFARKLITIGTPQMGIDDFPNEHGDWVIKALNYLFHQIVYTDFIQKFIGPSNF